VLNSWRLELLGILGNRRFHLCECELTELTSCTNLIKRIMPDELYNLAAQSFVGLSFAEPFATAQISGVAVLNLLESIRVVNPAMRFYQASSSELFGLVQEIPQTEKTPFHPRSPYAVAKLFAHWSAINYRESYGLFATCGLLYNHESPLRSKEFVTRKISHAAARISAGLDGELILGNLEISRDWGYAKEYVDGMYRMMQLDHADTFVLATNRTATIQEFTDLCFNAAGMDLEWEGSGLQTKGIDRKSGKVRVRVDENLYRPCEVGTMKGDATKAARMLGWNARTSLEELSSLMVREDQSRIAQGFKH
jgi:GDPmannose 4,6-dehydratase